MILSEKPLVIDIGGEGRHAQAYNVNPRQCKTYGPEKGLPIPRLVVGRSESIPLPERCADSIIVERTPLSLRALLEITRIARPGAEIVLRHAQAFGMDPHRLAKQIIKGAVRECDCKIGGQSYRETSFILDADTITPLS